MLEKKTAYRTNTQTLLRFKDYLLYSKRMSKSIILFVTTARQATRMFFPLAMFVTVWSTEGYTREFADVSSTTGAGGWYTYKKACEIGTLMEEPSRSNGRGKGISNSIS